MTHEQLIKAVDQLPVGELDSFVNEVLSLRARKMAKCLSREETELFRVINRELSDEASERSALLVKKRNAGTITAPELEELIALTDELENLGVQRLEALIKLAQLRGVTLDQLRHDLQLTSLNVE